MDFQIVNFQTGYVVARIAYKGGRHRARINRQVARMNEIAGEDTYTIENIQE